MSFLTFFLTLQAITQHCSCGYFSFPQWEREVITDRLPRESVPIIGYRSFFVFSTALCTIQIQKHTQKSYVCPAQISVNGPLSMDLSLSLRYSLHHAEPGLGNGRANSPFVRRWAIFLVRAGLVERVTCIPPVFLVLFPCSYF